MNRHTLTITVAELMRAYIDARVSAGHYGSASEYLRELVLRDQESQVRQRLRGSIDEGLASGLGRRVSDADEKALVGIARGEAG